MTKKLTQQQAEKKSINFGVEMIGEYVNVITKTDFICPLCSKIFRCRPHDIWTGNTIGCGCAKHLKGMKNKKYLGYLDISGEFIDKHNFNAKTRGIIGTLTPKQVYDLYIKQNKQCNLSGTPIYFDDIIKTNCTASIDRIDCNKNTYINNAQLVHKTINYIKNNIDEDIFILLCFLITNPSKKSDEHIPLQLIEDNIRFSSWKGYKSISQTEYYNISYSRLKKFGSFNISIRDMWSVYVQQNGCCKLTGLPLTFNVETIQYRGTASLDRINSSIGYELSNIQFLHKTINRMKWGLKENNFVHWCNLVSNKNNPKINIDLLQSVVSPFTLEHRKNLIEILKKRIRRRISNANKE